MGAIQLGSDKAVDCDLDEAKAVIAGYCFGTRKLGWKQREDLVVGDPIRDRERPIWAYRVYDCVPASRGDRLTMHDVLLTAGLNSRIGSRAATGASSVLREINAALSELNPRTDFWKLSAPDLRRVPKLASPARFLWLAWSVLDGVPGVGTAISHKILHHKRPNQFPLLDSRTLSKYENPEESWTCINLELRAAAKQFAELEHWFADLADQREGRHLTRLRLHDILLWCQTTNQWPAAAKKGEEILRDERTRQR